MSVNLDNANRLADETANELKTQFANISTLPTVAPPTQGTWRSNDYVNALRLVGWWMLGCFIRFYGVSGRRIIYILHVHHKHATSLIPIITFAFQPQHHILASLPTSHSHFLRRDTYSGISIPSRQYCHCSDRYSWLEDGYDTCKDRYRWLEDGYDPCKDRYRGLEDGYRGLEDGYLGLEEGYDPGKDRYRGLEDGYDKSQDYCWGYGGKHGGSRQTHSNYEHWVSLYLCEFIERMTVLKFVYRGQNNRKRIYNSGCTRPDEPLQELLSTDTGVPVSGFPRNVSAISIMTNKLIFRIFVAPDPDYYKWTKWGRWCRPSANNSYTR